MLTKIFLALFILATPVMAMKLNPHQVEEMAQEMDDGGLKKIAQKTDVTIGQIVNRGLSSLRDQGFDSEADKYESDYYTTYEGFVTKMVQDTRHIGDHAPLLAFLTTLYNSLEKNVCGGNVQLCKALHLTDIKTINYAIPVVFHPCTFDLNGLNVDREAEYRRHFAQDDDANALYGLMPVILYWGIEGACIFGTSGIGAILCGIAAAGAEHLVARTLAPNIADRIFVRACKQ